MAMTLADMAEGSPIHDYLGAPTESPASIFQASLKSAENDAAALEKSDMQSLQKVIDFVTEWKTCITDKVEGEIDEIHELNKRMHHYQTKVEKLRNKKHSIEADAAPKPMPKHPMTKGVISSEKLIDQLERNEKKFDEAWKEHEAKATRLVDLLEEITRRGWKILHQLARLLMKFESEYAANLNKKLSNLPQVMEDMTSSYHMHENVDAVRGEIPLAVNEYDDNDLDESTTDDESNDSSEKRGIMEGLKTKIAA